MKVASIETFEGKECLFKSVFHYKANKEIGIKDRDTYIEVIVTHDKPLGESLDEMHQKKTPLMLDNRYFWTSERLANVTPISVEEYEAYKNSKCN